MKRFLIVLFLGLILSFNSVSIKAETTDVEKLETLVVKAEDVLAKVKPDTGVLAAELPLDHQYAPKKMLDDLKELIQGSKDLLEKDDKTTEELEDMIHLLEEQLNLIDNNLIIGTKKSEYRELVLKIGALMVILGIIGGISLVVLVKKYKKETF